MKNTTNHPDNQIYRDFFKLINAPNAQLLQDEQSATSHIIIPDTETPDHTEPIDLLEKTWYHFDTNELETTITFIPNAIVITIEH